MLERNYQRLFDDLIHSVQWQIDLPMELTAFFEQRGYTTPNAFDERQCPRARSRHRAVMYFTRPLPAFPRFAEPVGIYTTDLSRIGIGLLCHQQLWPGEEVRILLPGCWMNATIVRGRRLGPTCFESGALLQEVLAPHEDAFDMSGSLVA